MPKLNCVQHGRGVIEFGDEFLKGGENVIPKYFEEKKKL